MPGPFDIKPAEQQPANFTGYSRGIRADRNSSLGTLFKGLAQAVDTGVQEADRFQKEQIREDIFGQVDAIQNEFGVGDATGIEREVSDVARPSELERAGSNLETLQLAYERGALRESHYWARMNSMVRQLRSRYPGYRAEIDSMVSGITGARPANALRSALFREWAQDSASSPSQLDKLVSSATNAGTLPVEYYDRLESTNPFSFVELQERVAEKNRQIFDGRAASARIALVASEGNLQDDQVKRYSQTAFQGLVNQTVSDTLQAGGGYQVIRSRIDDSAALLAEGKPLDQEQLQQDRALIGQLALDLELALLQKSNEPLGPDNLDSIATLMSPADVQSQIQSAMAPIRLLQKALASDNPNGIMTAMAAVDEARREDALREVFASNTVLENISVLNDAVGPGATTIVLGTSQKSQEALVVALSAIDAGNLLERNRTVSDGAVLAAKASPEVGRDYVQNSIDTLIQRLNLKDTLPLEVIQAEVYRVFSPEASRVLAMLDKPSRLSYFRQVSTGIITKQMIELKNMGDIESWNMYQDWVSTEFRQLFSSRVADISSLGDTEGIAVKWDPVSYGFTFQSEGFFLPGLEGELANDLNTAIRSIVPIIKENGGSVPEELALLVQQMGFREGTIAPVPGRESFPYKILQALGLKPPTPVQTLPVPMPGGVLVPTR